MHILAKFRARQSGFQAVSLEPLTVVSPPRTLPVGVRRSPFRLLRYFTIAALVSFAVVGIALSTLHQSGLGALFMMAKGKIHPLWYTEFIPVLFFVSSIFAGISMVMIEGFFTHRAFRHRMGHEIHANHDAILLGLAADLGAERMVGAQQQVAARGEAQEARP